MKDTGLVNTPSVRRVRQDYLKSFRELQAAEKPSDAKTVATFTATVKRAQARGCDTVLLMAKGLQELMWGSGKRNSRTERSQGDAEGGVGRSGRETGQGWSAAQGREAVPTICPHLGRVQDFLDNFYQVCMGVCFCLCLCLFFGKYELFTVSYMIDRIWSYLMDGI